jgi:putative ABC transport system ATP-binding protein
MSNHNKAVIELKDVWKIYHLGDNVVNALCGLSFSVKEGEFVSIIGKSGSGKTTAVNMIGCLDTPSKGSISLGKHKVSNLSESELAQIRGRKIGYIFQKFNLVKTLSAQENVELPMIFQGIPKYERESRAKELLVQLDMGDRLINKPSELSGGQQQRVAIARALANEPEVILADEPTGNLDSRTGKIVMEYLKKLHSEGKTIILVTHDEKLSHYAHRRITLSDGKILSDEINNKIVK